MNKIITENPQTMVKHMHNFVCVKDRDVYVRIDEKEVSLVDYIRKIDKELYGIEHDDEYCNALEFGEYMDDDRFTCIMYHALVGFAEVREHLKYYEDEAEKIKLNCTKPCHMEKDIKLIEREYNEGYAPYRQILVQHKRQLKECPKICSRYKQG